MQISRGGSSSPISVQALRVLIRGCGYEDLLGKGFDNDNDDEDDEDNDGDDVYGDSGILCVSGNGRVQHKGILGKFPKDVGLHASL